MVLVAGVDPHLGTPRQLRHYFGLTSAMAGVPNTALMRALGDRAPIMTARYSEFADAERRWTFARADIMSGITVPGGWSEVRPLGRPIRVGGTDLQRRPHAS